MKRQLIYIHGGDAFKNKDVFVEHLRAVKLREPVISVPGARSLRWSDTLPGDLSPEVDVYMPTMPNKQNADFLEWKVWFEKYLELVADGAIFVGWSMGAWFLAKYIAETPLRVNPKAVFLVAGPAGVINDEEDNLDWNFSLADFGSRVGEKGIKTFIFHSEDDPVVPYAHALRYKEALPEAQFHTFSSRGHFVMGDFPELVSAIRGTI